MIRRVILFAAFAAALPCVAGAQASVAERLGEIRDASGQGDHAFARRIVGGDFFERNTPDARTSTTGEVVGDWYYYLGNGQLDRMNQRSIDAATMEPVRLYRTPLLPETEESLVAVALSAADSVALLDGHALERLSTVAVGAGPHEIAPSANRRTLYVADAADSSVTVLALSPAPRVAATWRLPDGIRVHDVAPDEAASSGRCRASRRCSSGSRPRAAASSDGTRSGAREAGWWMHGVPAA